jgi:class 3 adenylate cyclase
MRLRRKITLAFFLVSTLVSLLLAMFLYRFVERQLGTELRTRLRDVTLVGAHAVDRAAYARLTAKLAPELAEADVAAIEHGADYAAIDRTLNVVRAAEPDLIRYVYLIAPTANPDEARYVVDADVRHSTDPEEQLSHFGQALDMSALPGMKRALAECTTLVEDDFVWDPEYKVYSVSAYAPLDGKAGACTGVLGVDITDKDMRAALDSAGSLSIRVSLAVIALALLVSVAMGTVLTRSVLALTATVKRFADKDFTARTQIKARDEIGQLGDNFNAMAATIQEHSDNLEGLVAKRTSELAAEKQTSERLLLNVLPGPIADRLKQGEGLIVDRFDEVSVLFADLVGFTALSARTSPEVLVGMLDELFSEFDRLAEKHGLEKIKTIGDAYMVVAGIPEARDDHARAMARMGLDMMAVIEAYAARTGSDLTIRVGINTGSVVAGVIGRKKFIYDLWGDTVNTASRMESHGLPGKVHVSAATRAKLGDDFELEARGTIDIKGKGLMETFVLVRERGEREG